MKFKNIILASQSPRRKELLKLIFDEFEIIPSNAEEIVPENIGIETYCEYLAKIKAQDIARNHPQSLVIGADTIVVIDDTVLGKPKTREEAICMLSSLSGRTHSVYTGCAVIFGDKVISFTAKTDVTFYELTKKEIEDYVDTKDCFDKAGGYGIQSKGVTLVKEICGDYNNVVGLPVSRLKREIFTNFT